MSAVRFTRDHEWVRQEGDLAVIGITDYAQSQLGDVVYVELPEPGRQVEQGKEAAVVESAKAASEVYSPVTGEVTAQVHVTEALARTDGPLQPGTSASGAGGVQMKLGDVTTIKPGEIKLSVELSLPPDVQPAGQLPAAMNRVAFQGGMVIQQQIMVGPGMKPMAPPLAAGTTEFGGLSLEDAQGRRWSAVSGIQESMRLGPQGLTSQLTLTFKLKLISKMLQSILIMF